MPTIIENAATPSPREADIDLERDVFLRRLVRSLAGTLEDTIGLQDAEGYVSVVGQDVGEQIDAAYRQALQVDQLDREQVADVLVDLKRRIKGDFYIVESDEEKIVLGNRACPFGEFVKGRPSLCMMTSNVFGHIAADNLGYARVAIEEAIARGDPGCRVVVHLKPGGEEAEHERDYFRA